MASEFEPRNPGYEAQVRESFARQRVMELIGAKMSAVTPGAVEITLPARDDLTQQHGFIHAGVITTIVDSACGYAALTLAPAGSDVLTIEYKVNFMEPARGERFIARGRVLRTGRVITVSAGDVYALHDGRERPIATMLATMRIKSERSA